jgi:hypothetical protein
MAKSVFKRAKIRRMLFTIGKLILIFLAMIASFITALYTTTKGANWMPIFGLFLILLIGAVFLGLQWYTDYMKRTYDPNLALLYQNRWEDECFLKRRVDAAKCIRANKNNLANIEEHARDLCVIDWVLDLLEDIGFYEHGYQISPEVAYHHFYHYIRGYWQWTEQYIKAWQSQPHDKARWEYIEELYKTTSELAAKKGESTALGVRELEKFLKDEIELLDEYESGQSFPIK